MTGIELFGYIASVFVVLSLMMSNIFYLRIINLIGASSFALYGYIIGSYPVVVVNGSITLIDIYYLVLILKARNSYDLNETFTGKEHFFKQFMDHFKADIKKYFPEYHFDSIKNPQIILSSRDIVPVGFFIYEALDDGSMQIHLDYVRPKFRDLKNSKFIFDQKLDEFRKKYKRIVVHSTVKQHQKYLQKMGFVSSSEKENDFVYQLRS